MDKFGRMSFDYLGKGGLQLSGSKSSKASVDSGIQNITNINNPTQPADAANKAYVDQKVIAMQLDIQKTLKDQNDEHDFQIRSIKRLMDGFDDHVQQSFARESILVKVPDWYELFKDEIKHEKNKLINSVLDLISGKIEKPLPLGNTDPAYINKLELLAVLEAWRS